MSFDSFEQSSSAQRVRENQLHIVHVGLIEFLQIRHLTTPGFV
jgi:hypothetical protein